MSNNHPLLQGAQDTSPYHANGHAPSPYSDSSAPHYNYGASAPGPANYANNYADPQSPYANPSGPSKDAPPSYSQPQPSPYQPQPSPYQPQPSPQQQQQYHQPQQPYIDPYYANYRSTADPTLPIGWEVFYDIEKRPYYSNMSSGRTQWAHPTTGQQYDAYAPAYEVPDYYTAVQQQQQKEYTDFSPVRPEFNPESSAMPDANSPYNPNYYNKEIQQKTDPNILNQAQLDTLAPKWVDIDKYTQNLTCAQRTCGTIGKNKCLSVVTFLLWAALIVGGVLIALHPGSDGLEMAPAYMGGAIAVFVVYWAIFLVPAGCMPLFMFCCGCSPCLSDKPVETLRAKANKDTSIMKQNIQSMKAAAPSLVLHVECYHYETRVSYHNVTRNGKTHRERRETREKVTSYRGHRTIPIIRYRDLSASELTIADISEQCPSNVISVNYSYVYELHSLQQTLLAQLKSQYYYSYCWYDDHCVVSTHYSINGPQPDVDVVVKEKDGGYYASRLCFFNPFSFFFWGYTTLLLPFMMMYRTFIRPIPFANVKYLHIGNPNPANDVTTYHVPRWRLRWTFW